MSSFSFPVNFDDAHEVPFVKWRYDLYIIEEISPPKPRAPVRHSNIGISEDSYPTVMGHMRHIISGMFLFFVFATVEIMEYRENYLEIGETLPDLHNLQNSPRWLIGRFGYRYFRYKLEHSLLHQLIVIISHCNFPYRFELSMGYLYVK